MTREEALQWSREHALAVRSLDEEWWLEVYPLLTGTVRLCLVLYPTTAWFGYPDQVDEW